MFCGPETKTAVEGRHKTHCFPEVPVNKCFVIYYSVKRQNIVRKMLILGAPEGRPRILYTSGFHRN